VPVGKINLEKKKAEASLRGFPSERLSVDCLCFTGAQKVAQSDKEKEEAEACVEEATAELSRQQRVKAAHDRALEVLAADGHRCEDRQCCTNTKDAIEAIEKALEEEGDDNTPERRALQKLLEACTEWQSADCAMRDWDGEKAVEDLKHCKLRSEQAEGMHRADDCMKTPGYYGDQIGFNPSVKTVLQIYTEKAHEEVRRRAKFEDHKKIGGETLAVHKAEEALRHYTKMREFGEIRSGHLEHSNTDEVEDAEICLAAAQQELDRQMNVKRCHGEATAHLERCVDLKIPPIDDVSRRRRWQCFQNRDVCIAQARAATQDALDYEKESVTNAHAIESPERNALRQVLKAIDCWQRGNDQMRNAIFRQEDQLQDCGKLALQQYLDVEEFSDKIKQVLPTPGYYPERPVSECTRDGDTIAQRWAVHGRVEFSPKVITGLSEFMKEAQAQMHRLENFRKKMGEAESRLAQNDSETSWSLETESSEDFHFPPASAFYQSVTNSYTLQSVPTNVHSLSAFRNFTGAFELARSAPERDQVVGRMLVALAQLRASLHMERTKQAGRVLHAKKHLNGEAISFDSTVDLDDVPSSSEVAARRWPKPWGWGRDGFEWNTEALGLKGLINTLRNIDEWVLWSPSLVPWERLESELDNALEQNERMLSDNQRIRDAKTERLHGDQPLGGFDASDRDVAGILEEGDEGESDEEAESTQFERMESHSFDLLVRNRDEHRMRFIECGEIYSRTEQVVKKEGGQKQDLEQLLRELRFELLNCIRVHRSLRSFCSVPRNWQIAGAAEMAEARLQAGTGKWSPEIRLSALSNDHRTGIWAIEKHVEGFFSDADHVIDADIIMRGDLVAWVEKTGKALTERSEAFTVSLLPYELQTDTLGDWQHCEIRQLRFKRSVGFAEKLADGTLLQKEKNICEFVRRDTSTEGTIDGMYDDGWLPMGTRPSSCWLVDRSADGDLPPPEKVSAKEEDPRWVYPANEPIEEEVLVHGPHTPNATKTTQHETLPAPPHTSSQVKEMKQPRDAWLSKTSSNLRQCELLVQAVPSHKATHNGKEIDVDFAIDLLSQHHAEGTTRILRLVAKDRESQDYWVRRLGSRFKLLQKQQMPQPDPEPDPEPEPEQSFQLPGTQSFQLPDTASAIFAGVGADVGYLHGRRLESESDCLEKLKGAAHDAVLLIDSWEESLCHDKSIQRTDLKLKELASIVTAIEQDEAWTEQDGSSLRDYDLSPIGKLEQAAEALKSCVRVERALREIDPLENLRATLWGVEPSRGQSVVEGYPQLSTDQILRSIRRFLCALGDEFAAVPDEHAADKLPTRVRSEELKTTCAGNPELEFCRCTFIKYCDVDRGGFRHSMMEAALKIRHLMKLELERTNSTLARASSKQVHDQVASCKPNRIGDCAPDTTVLKELQATLADQRAAFRKARFDFNEMEEMKRTYAPGHPKYPTAAQERELSVQLKQRRAQVNNSNKELKLELSLLYKNGAEHWPEVLRTVQKVESAVTLDCYEDITPLTGKGRNEVSTANFQGKRVVLKAYDLLKDKGASSDKVMEEIKQLEQMRHPNIVEVQNWFEHRAQGEIKIYVQMPCYDQDLCDWIKAPSDVEMRSQEFITKRRTVLLGLLRAVGRVHEFNQTHNDLKPENVLVTTDQGKIRSVLCDFELLTPVDTGKRSGFTTGVGGTEPYSAPERYGFTSAKRPTPASDMYSVGVVILLCFARGHLDDARMDDPPDWTAAKGEDRLKWQRHWLHLLGKAQASMPDEVHELIRQLLGTDAGRRPTARELFNRDSYFNRADAGFPVYWRHVSDEHILRDLHEVDGVTLDRIRDVLEPQMPDQLGKGRDAGRQWKNMGLEEGDRSIHVAKAWRVQSRSLWNRYSVAMESMADAISCGPPLNQIAGNREKIMETPGWPEREMGCSRGGEALEEAAKRGFDPSGEDSIRQDVNEAFLLHGLPSDALQKVVETGFNQNYSGANAGSLFGDGCYLTQDIEKADQYTKEAEEAEDHDGSGNELHKMLYPGGASDHPGNVSYVLICRVALGYSIRTRGRFFNDATRKYQKQCTAIDEGASVKTDCTYSAMTTSGKWQPRTFSHPRGFVFEAETARELVKVPASPEQRAQGMPETAVNYHSLVVETGGTNGVIRHREFVTFHGEYVYPDFVVAYQRTHRSGQPPRSLEPEPEPE
jgi:serine/threonine protein kinase